MLYCVVNPNARSGKGIEIWEEAKNYLDEKGIAYEENLTEFPGHTAYLTMQVIDRALKDLADSDAESTGSENDEKVDLLILGGDGTVNGAINGITEFDKVRLGILPVGSGNDLARGLAVGSDVRENLDTIIRNSESGTVRSMDLGKVTWNDGHNYRYFAVSSGVGMDAEACERVESSTSKILLNKIGLGKLVYVLETLIALFTMETAVAKVVSENGKKLLLNKLIFLAAMNHRCEGGGVPMAPYADVYDGRLNLSCAYKIPKWKTFFMLPLLVMGKQEKIDGFGLSSFKGCTIDLDVPMCLHTDGEFIGRVEHVKYECLPGILQILN